MDYGPFLSASVEVEPGNIANKGIAVMVGSTPDGDVSMLFDTDLLRWAAGWQGDGVALRGIVYDGPHGIHPAVDGTIDWSTSVKPGVSTSGEFADLRPWKYGPLNKRDGEWRGLRVSGDEVGFAYQSGRTEILETPGLLTLNGLIAYTRTLSIKGSDQNLMLKILNSDRDSLKSLDSFGIEIDNDPASIGQRFGVVVEVSGSPSLAIGLVQPSSDDARVIQRGSEVFVEINPGMQSVSQIMMIILSPIEGRDDLVTFGRLLDSVKIPRNLDHLVYPMQSNSTMAEPDATTRIQSLSLESEQNDVQNIVRSKGDDALEVELEYWPGSVFSLRTMSGMQLESKQSSTSDSYVLAVPPSGGLEERPLASWSFDRVSDGLIQNDMTGRKDLRLDGVTFRRGLKGRCLDFDGTGRARWLNPRPFSLNSSDFSFACWISTRSDGTIMSIMDPSDDWAPGEVAFFIRDGRLAFDIGWQGVIEGSASIADGQWNHVACTWSHDDEEVRLYVNGALDVQGVLSPGTMTENRILQLGCAAMDFPTPSYFSGFMEGVEFFNEILDERQLQVQAASSGSPIVKAWMLSGTQQGQWLRRNDGDVVLKLPVSRSSQQVQLHHWQGPLDQLSQAIGHLNQTSSDQRPFQIQEIIRPVENPANSWMRFGSMDFIPGQNSIVITTWSGDVWLIEFDKDDESSAHWTRIASGLNQPLGIAMRDGEILVLGRDQVTRLVDLNGDFVTDFYENVNNDTMNSAHFHEPATGLQVARNGDLFYLKAARHAKDACHPHHGTLVRISADNLESTVLASGFRAPNGLLLDQENVFFCSDQEGHWMPANRINRVEPGGFYGNKWTGHEARERNTFDRPLTWIHPRVDRSPSAQLRIDDSSWGVLNGRLIGLSYGTGSVYLILEDEVNGVHQGGIVPLPIKVPTGLMSGRFSPVDGGLYLCGLVGWSSDATHDGGLYRVMPSGRMPPLPIEIKAMKDGLVLEFNEPLDKESVDIRRWTVEGWNYRWSQDYGSPDIMLDGSQEGRTRLEVKKAVLSPDRRKVWLMMPQMTSAMQMHVEYVLPFNGQEREGFAHISVHEMHDLSGRRLVNP